MGKLTHQTPATGLKGLKENWRNDIIAALSVSLVALPLAIGVAEASNVPPMSGVLAAIIGGVVTTIFRGSHVAINGPAAGLIAVIVSAMYSLNDGTGKTFQYVLAAITISGVLQILLGVFRMGRFADIFPSSVINGIMAAIGIIIFSSQIHVALGTQTDAKHPIDYLQDLVYNIGTINPFVAIISVFALLLLFFHSRISYKLFHFIPAQVWVLGLAIPFVYAFNFFETHTIDFLGISHQVGPELLIDIPGSIFDAILFPDYSMIGKPTFWIAVISITLIASLQTLAMAKAVDKIDPYGRKTRLNKDLIGVGIATLVSGCLGGLPIITVIVRSKVNVQNNAKTGWSNFFHGILILVFIILLAPIIQKMPLAAFGAILVFIGFKLAAPRVFSAAYDQGMEQLLFLIGTLMITLFTNNLLWGIFGGILLTLLVHILLARVPIPVFFQMVFNSGTKVLEKEDGSIEVKFKGIQNFLSMIKLRKIYSEIPAGKDVKLNFSSARLVDLTVLESIESFKKNHKDTGGKVQLFGLDSHVASAKHRHALRSKFKPLPHKLSPREQRIKKIATRKGWKYRYEMEWDDSYLRNFQFFETRPIERKYNIINGDYKNLDIQWEISDITFDEGALIATEVYHTTTQLLRLPFEIPKFVVEKEGFFDKIFDRMMAFTGQKDIDFELYTDFSDRFLLKGEDEKTIREFFTAELIHFLELDNVYHIESNGEALLIFRYLRLGRTEEISSMLDFSEHLIEVISEK
ncbi:MAG: MFS superfamily sulfate permease-like transporter [Paraglaciecola sp.]|jgi:MFS superfamily sulfate permease-like transporter